MEYSLEIGLGGVVVSDANGEYVTSMSEADVIAIIMNHQGVRMTPNPAVVRKEIMAFLEKDQLIQAIKARRTATGEGLKDAKDAVERIRDMRRTMITMIRNSGDLVPAAQLYMDTMESERMESERTEAMDYASKLAVQIEKGR